MYVFEIIIALLLAGAGLTALARRIGTPYPAMVALAGAALALVPGTPTLVLDPELALTLFVAPVLLDAAFDASPRDLRANWRSVAGLALGAVALTIVMVAIVTRLLVPGMPWPAAVALGAIVAPPDAAAATAVLRQLRPPRRLLVILEGESLFNDASALLVYRLAVGAMLAGTLSPGSVIPTLLIVTVGSVVLGFVLSRVLLSVTRRISDVAIAVVVQFCGTFAVWMLAERLHLSGILTVVVFAMVTARRAGDLIPARIRIPSYAVWEFAVFVLNVLAFILVGFQLKAILGRIDAGTLVEYIGVAVAVCITTILARIAWVSGAAAFSRWRCRPAPDGTQKRDDTVGLSHRRGRGRRLVWHARHRHTGRRAGAASRRLRRSRVPVPRPDSVHRVLRGARHARHPGHDAPAFDECTSAGGRRFGRARGEGGASRDAARSADSDGGVTRRGDVGFAQTTIRGAPQARGVRARQRRRRA